MVVEVTKTGVRDLKTSKALCIVLDTFLSARCTGLFPSAGRLPLPFLGGKTYVEKIYLRAIYVHIRAYTSHICLYIVRMFLIIYVYACTYVYACICMYCTYMLVCTCTHVYACICTYSRIYVYERMNVYASICKY